MLTIDDVRSIPLFSTLPDSELELLAEREPERVASAVGEGSMAIAFVHKFLQQDAR